MDTALWIVTFGLLVLNLINGLDTFFLRYELRQEAKKVKNLETNLQLVNAKVNIAFAENNLLNKIIENIGRETDTLHKVNLDLRKTFDSLKTYEPELKTEYDQDDTQGKHHKTAEAAPGPW